jgi:LysM repeat protein
VILEGTVYYIHTVKPGETLYAISKAYNISQKEIAIENPGVISGLQIGQSLKIPVEPKLKSEIDTSEQEEGTRVGKIHTVQAGETLYGISRMYTMSVEDIEQANPGITAENISVGDRLTIPEDQQGEEEHAYNEEGLVYHKVKRRETLYSIASYYHVGVEDIRAANPELGWGGPKTGQVIRIPKPQITDQQQAGNDLNRPDEPEFQGDSVEIEAYDYNELDTGYENINRTYRVAFFVPFDFREMEPLDSLTKDVESLTRKNRIIERYMIEQRIPQSRNFLEFFQGTLMAIDSMRRTGMKLEVHYFDTRRSTSRVNSLLMDDSFEDFDLFLGPFYDFTLELVSSFARKNRIPVVTPFYNELDLVRDNPYLFQLSPSIERGYREAAKLVASKYRYNIVYVRQEDTLNLDLEKNDYFKQLIFDGFDDYLPSEPVQFKEVVMEVRNTEKIIQSLSADKKNLVVVPTADAALASTVINTLYFQHQLNDYDIEVIGGPYWTEFSTIELEYFHELNLLFYSSFWVNYLDPRVDEFMSKFRSYYFNEPTLTTKKGVNYGILGYDMSMYFLNALRMYGSRFILSLDQYKPTLVQGPFIFDRISRGGGYENAHISFYRYSPDMTIQQIEVPEPPRPRYYFRPMEDRRRRRYLNFEGGIN